MSSIQEAKFNDIEEFELKNLNQKLVHTSQTKSTVMGPKVEKMKIAESKTLVSKNVDKLKKNGSKNKFKCENIGFQNTKVQKLKLHQKHDPITVSKKHLDHEQMKEKNNELETKEKSNFQKTRKYDEKCNSECSKYHPYFDNDLFKECTFQPNLDHFNFDKVRSFQEFFQSQKEFLLKKNKGISDKKIIPSSIQCNLSEKHKFTSKIPFHLKRSIYSNSPKRSIFEKLHNSNYEERSKIFRSLSNDPEIDQKLHLYTSENKEGLIYSSIDKYLSNPKPKSKKDIGTNENYDAALKKGNHSSDQYLESKFSKEFQSICNYLNIEQEFINYNQCENILRNFFFTSNTDMNYKELSLFKNIWDILSEKNMRTVKVKNLFTFILIILNMGNYSNLKAKRIKISLGTQNSDKLKNNDKNIPNDSSLKNEFQFDSNGNFIANEYSILYIQANFYELRLKRFYQQMPPNYK